MSRGGPNSPENKIHIREVDFGFSEMFGIIPVDWKVLEGSGRVHHGAHDLGGPPWAGMLPGLMGQGHLAPRPRPANPLGFPGGINWGRKALSLLGRRPPNPRWEGGHLGRPAPYIKRGGGGRPHHPPITSSSCRLSLHHTLSGLRRSPAVFFLHHHHHAVVLLDVGGYLPHLRCPLNGRGRSFIDTIMAPPSINFNQFLEKEKLKGNGSNFTGSVIVPSCAALEAELQKRFEHHDPCEMMRELKLIFETHAAVESYEASKQFFNCMMEEGSSVSEHMFAMSGHAKKLSDLGIVIPNKLGIHRVLQSLPPSYKNFVMNYNMQNMNKELPELFSMLKSAEVEIKKENQVLMVNKTTGFKKQGKPNKGNFKKGGKKVAAPPEKPKAGPKPETMCYYCQGKGHWKRNCTKYLADLKSGHVKKKGIFDIHVIDVYLTGSRSSAWVFDTGSVAHICNSKQELRNKRSLARDEVTMRCALEMDPRSM
ncbi:hypothetical protein QYE76_042403 [Lolium multiflorum]|uniref:CCHC-type domain-containing protein n=1 Tax=Lolium multiflorum TaxID=4521 RepID=A0AAD8WUW5_LOLMU|nr:hypothetical protein QYE76_042403 [Lolium multiflorum]